MKQKFREKLQLNKKNEEQLRIINEIIEEYAEQGYKLTLRQLFGIIYFHGHIKSWHFGQPIFIFLCS